MVKASSVLPNPFDKKSTLPELAKRIELMEGTLSLASLIKQCGESILVLLLLAFTFIYFFNIPSTIVTVLVGLEILGTLLSIYIKTSRLRAVFNVTTQRTAYSYRTLFIMTEYYTLLESVVATLLSLTALGIVYYSFTREIADFLTLNQSNINLNYLLFVFVIFRIVRGTLAFIRYYLIKTLKQTTNLAELNRDYLLVEKKLKFVSDIQGSGVIVVASLLLGVPPFLVIGIVGVLLLALFLSVVQISRIKNVDLNQTAIDPLIVQHPISVYKNEKILGSVFGIMRCASGFFDMLRPAGSASLGVGKSYYPENTLLVTNHRLLFIQILVTGGNNIVGDVDYAQQNFFFNRGELIKKGQQVLRTSTVPQLVKLATNDVLYTDIKTLTLKPFKLIVQKLNGETFSYGFMDPEHNTQLPRLLPSLLKEKLVVK